MYILFKLLLMMLPLNIFGVQLKDYCKNEKSTPCYQKCGRSSKCGNTKDGFQILSDTLRQSILDKHNTLRNVAASGKYVDKFLPKASNMAALSYDKETEFLAACYIKQCLKEPDKVRITRDGTNLGQNIESQVFHKEGSISKTLLNHAAQNWFNEYKLLNANNTQSFHKKFSLVRPVVHLTQLLWATTKYVGCAAMHSIRKKGTHNYDVICNYRPSGNMEGGKVYNAGDPDCSLQNEIYPGLCGIIRPMKKDTYQAPLDLNGSKRISPNFFIMLTLFIVFYCSVF